MYWVSSARFCASVTFHFPHSYDDKHYKLLYSGTESGNTLRVAEHSNTFDKDGEDEMVRGLVIAGGVLHILFALFHVVLQWGLAADASLSSGSADIRATLFTLNVVWTFVLLVFGYISIFRSREMIATGIGRALSFCIALTWFLRLLAEFEYYGYSGIGTILFVAIFALVGSMYLIPVMLPKQESIRATLAES